MLHRQSFPSQNVDFNFRAPQHCRDDKLGIKHVNVSDGDLKGILKMLMSILLMKQCSSAEVMQGDSSHEDLNVQSQVIFAPRNQ